MLQLSADHQRHGEFKMPAWHPDPPQTKCSECSRLHQLQPAQALISRPSFQSSMERLPPYILLEAQRRQRRWIWAERTTANGLNGQQRDNIFPTYTLRRCFSITIEVILLVSLKCVCFLVLTHSVVFYRSRMREEISDFLLDECD